MLSEDTIIPSRKNNDSAGTRDREFRYSQADFRAISAVLRDEAGINLSDGKAPLVYARLAKRLRSLDLDDFADYVALLQGSKAADERRQLVSALTTNVTRFFREPHHFKHLRTHLVAPLLQTRKFGRCRLWSAACSTGQEPYSMAAVLADAIPGIARMDVKILATDIDPVVLQQADTGRYETLDGVPPEMRRWFERDGNGWSVDPVLHGLVTFKRLNLNAQWPVRGPFDAIFCRNVAIYFDHDVQARLWSGFAGVLRPGRALYIGHSERICGPAWAAFDNIGVTAYQRRTAGT